MVRDGNRQLGAINCGYHQSRPPCGLIILLFNAIQPKILLAPENTSLQFVVSIRLKEGIV